MDQKSALTALKKILKTTPIQTVWDPKSSNLEFLAENFLYMISYHKNTLCTTDLKKVLWWQFLIF